VDRLARSARLAESFETGLNRWHWEHEHRARRRSAADAMLMGRKTYEVYAATWPGRHSAYADMINAIPKYVASTTLTDPAWSNTTVLEGDLTEAVRELDGESILMHGYGPVAKTLLAADLLTELHLWVHPQLAGVGGPDDLLLHQGLNKRLELVGTRVLDSRVVVLTLRNPDG
jgi:dihydrofolate reductase